ncbi:hypothetical protein AVO45_08005 [Ruegeria marisrubri]|uniref:Basal-body rod modification protein FlgD n=1 Tax=Ruegeria marisrubri TaxID=1685379 RepID=A0A0X3TQ95_9RHOB|nr:flagellar hook capping FlgD N-terminal domain-containing protein [Ruegeria marisrubri]KUJ77907.1 hypothetical protein AVO45_08005 [Ruegeria marisrubri]
MITETGPSVQREITGNQVAQRETKSGLTSDFETFLKMLTAQAKNQDPLDPLESTEYAAQLAQFSMVEQQVQTNDLLNGLAATLGGSGLGRLAGWVGMEVSSIGPAQYDGESITVLPTHAATADTAYLVVQDGTGATVDRFAIPLSSDSVAWPRQEERTIHPSGPYSFSVESYRAGSLVSKDPAATYGRVTEAHLREGEVTLTLVGGQSVDAASVKAIRAGS